MFAFVSWVREDFLPLKTRIGNVYINTSGRGLKHCSLIMGLPNNDDLIRWVLNENDLKQKSLENFSKCLSNGFT